MRGIGAGQRIHLYVIPEVADLLRRELIAAGGDAVRAMREELEGHQNSTNGAQDGHMNTSSQNQVMSQDTVLQDVVAWLVVNSMRSEQTQWSMLCLQNIANIYRKNAFRRIHNGIDEFLSTKPDDENKIRNAAQDAHENAARGARGPVRLLSDDGDVDAQQAPLSAGRRETQNPTSAVLQDSNMLGAQKDSSSADAKICAKKLTVHVCGEDGEDAAGRGSDTLVPAHGRDSRDEIQTQTVACIDSAADADFDARIDALPLRRSLAVFEEGIDHSLEAAVPDPIPFEEKLRGMLDAHDAFLLTESEHAVGLSVLQEVGQFALLGDSANRLDTEQEREQEQEQEKEVKARRDQQVGVCVCVFVCLGACMHGKREGTQRSVGWGVCICVTYLHT
jgi:hypothetical protein